MQITKTLLIAGSAAALLATPALAQARRFPVRKPPTAAQTGTQTTPPPQDRTQRRGPERGEHGGGYYPGGSLYRSSYAPSFVGQDGQVYANFGYGYERVAQRCTAGQQTQQPRAQQPQPYSQPEVTQPVPQPQTTNPGTSPQQPGYSGLTPSNATTMHVGPPTQMAAAACYSPLSNGSVSVRR
jgi:hypothetical protein